MPRRGLLRATDALLPLAVAAAALALVAPSEAAAERSDAVLAALVLLTALTIAPSELARLRAYRAEVAALVLAPFALLVPLAWVASRPFDGAVADGVLALGVASTEVAAVGMVALAGGRAAPALGAPCRARWWPPRSRPRRSGRRPRPGAGVYGVLMLLAGAAAMSSARRPSPSWRDPRSRGAGPCP